MEMEKEEDEEEGEEEGLWQISICSGPEPETLIYMAESTSKVMAEE